MTVAALLVANKRKGYTVTHEKLMFNAPVLSTAEAATLLGLNSRFALDQRRHRGTGPKHHLIGGDNLKQPRIRYALRDLVEYGLSNMGIEPTKDTKDGTK